MAVKVRNGAIWKEDFQVVFCYQRYQGLLLKTRFDFVRNRTEKMQNRKGEVRWKTQTSYLTESVWSG